MQENGFCVSWSYNDAAKPLLMRRARQRWAHIQKKRRARRSGWSESGGEGDDPAPYGGREDCDSSSWRRQMRDAEEDKMDPDHRDFHFDEQLLRKVMKDIQQGKY